MNKEHKSNTAAEIKDLIERVNYLLDYNFDDGLFTRKVRQANQMPGMIAGNMDKSRKPRYIRITIDRKQYYAHRLAWLMSYGSFPIGVIDHIDGDGTNNRISNLRDVECKINSRNAKLNSNNTSGHCGVWFSENISKWVAGIMVDGVQIHIGCYKTKIEAVEARDCRAINLGFHKNHGLVRL